MQKRILCFEIAGIKFKYIYSEYINISKDATIHNFILNYGETFDVVNIIDVCNNIVDECKTDEEPIFIAPAWTMYSSFVVFHPNGELIAKMYMVDDYNEVRTLIKDLSFSVHPLPICITGFLLQRKLIEQKKGFLMHGAVIRVGDDAFVLTGNSGVGKSTLSSIISNNINCEQISDDRYVIRNDLGKYYAYGNPFDAKAERNLNKGVEIKRIIFLHHDIHNHHKVVEKDERMKKILTVSMLPYWESSYLNWSLQLLYEMVCGLDIYDLFFKPNAEVVEYMKNNGLLACLEG